MVFCGPLLSAAPGGFLGGAKGVALVSSEDSAGAAPAIWVKVTHTGQNPRTLGLIKPPGAIKPLPTSTQHSQGGLFFQGKYPF